MLDLLLVPAFALLALALRAVRRGAHRLHGHLMVSAITVGALRMVLGPRPLPSGPFATLLALLALAGLTMLLGRLALAWREGRSHRQHLPRIHRTFGALTLATLTLATLTLATLAWLLRVRG